MREEWTEAGLGRRILFVLAGLYWIGAAILFVEALMSAASSYDAGMALGFYSAPLLVAAVIRGAYVLLSGRRSRPRFWSWWLLVIGAALGLFMAFTRAASTIADRAT